MLVGDAMLPSSRQLILPCPSPRSDSAQLHAWKAALREFQRRDQKAGAMFGKGGMKVRRRMLVIEELDLDTIEPGNGPHGQLSLDCAAWIATTVAIAVNAIRRRKATAKP